MKVRDIQLPQYTLAQELWNSISHGLGAVFTLIAGPFLLVKAARTGDAWTIVSCSIFVFSLLLLYTFSCLYHALGRNNGKKVLRVMDHDMVFALILGSYTPYCLISLRQASPAWGWAILGSVYALSALGIVLNSVNIKKFAVFSMIDYLLIGWIIVIAFVPLFQVVAWQGVVLLMVGGLCYTVGSILYGIGKKHSPWWHTVFHFFVLAGTVLMFFSIYFYVVA
jgi:hemolysin III